MEREIPLFTLDGVKDADVTTYHFTTEDRLGLSLLRFQRGEAGEAVLVIHGLTTSTDMFIQPEHENLVSHLLDRGFGDVWSFDFRMSNRHPYNLHKHRFTMDDVALFDHPAALAEVRRHIGDRPLHVISHCLGSTTFTMALFGKAVTGVSSVIANSVALTPRVPPWSKIKLTLAPGLVENVLGFPYLNPGWGDDPGLSRGKLFSKAVSLFHRECDVPACHMLSLMWGTGWPALYHHHNMEPVTHRRARDLFGATSMHYYRHVLKMLKAGGAVKFNPGDARLDRLPDDYFTHVEEVETPVLFTTGADNKVFTDSNVECHRRMEQLVPGRHELAVFPGYGHQDVFMGKNVAQDVFPRMVEFIEKHRYDTPR
ncbi:MAG: alpha/beta fold hydrolase [Acidimicrobiales bacterium]